MVSNVNEKKGTEYTVIGNNILQCYIKENKCNPDAPFDLLPRERHELLMTAYRSYSPDIITLQECDEGWHDLLDREGGLPSLGYAPATDGFTDEPLRMIRNPVYFKRDRFEVEASGYGMYDGTDHGALANPWCYTWAVLRDRSCSKRFAVTSTHFVWVSIDNWEMRNRFALQLSAFLAELEEKHKVPVVALGDYNAHPKEPAYSTMKTHLLSAREVAQERINMEYRTATHFGRAPEICAEARGIVDHCFISRRGIIPRKYELIIEPMSYAYSDHVPQRLTFELE